MAVPIQPPVDPNVMLDRLVRLIVLHGLTSKEAALVRDLQRRRKLSAQVTVTRAELEQIKVIHNKLYRTKT